jgi:hypothetical protein
METSYNPSPLFMHFMLLNPHFFYGHHNLEGDVKIIPFVMGIYQGNPLGGAFFTLAHFMALCFIINCFLSYLFPSIVDVIHIISPPSIVSFI